MQGITRGRQSTHRTQLDFMLSIDRGNHTRLGCQMHISMNAKTWVLYKYKVRLCQTLQTGS